MLRYTKPPDVAATTHPRPLLKTAQGGAIAVDATLQSLWHQADGRALHEVIAGFHAHSATADTVRAALACLAEAGLLTRNTESSCPSPMPNTIGALVSAIIVGYDGRAWLAECLASLSAQTHSPLEIIVVDNASRDDSTDWLVVNYPQVRLLRLPHTQSLAHALNAGVAIAQGEYFLLLNQDVRLQPDAITQMAMAAQIDASCAAVAAKLKFWWAPSFLNGLGNRVGAFSWGTDNAIGHLDLGQFDDWHEVPSACFAATLIPRRAWQAVGPVDEGFPLYYEDVEWCYRARVMGYTIRAAPQAVVYHAFGGRIHTGDDGDLTPRKLRNAAYGRLRFALKVLGASNLRRFLCNYGLEDWANLTHALVRRDGATVHAYLGAWADFAKNWRTLLRERRALQARRTRSDTELFALQRTLPDPLAWRNLPELTWDLIQHHYLPLLISGKTRRMPEFENVERRPHLLVVSSDVVDAKMAGLGMRYLEMSRALRASLDVTLAVPAPTSLDVPGIRIVRYWEERPETLRVLVENSDIALIAGYMVKKFPFLLTTRTRLVVDLITPIVLENLHYYLREPLAAQDAPNREAVDITNQLARIGDFFICGSERQRDFWLGVLAANQRVNPRTFNQDVMLRSLIDVVGFGIPASPPVRRKPVFRGVHPAFGDQTKIVWWGGGMWDWLDSVTLAQAWPRVLSRHPEARLVFLLGHPNPLVPRHKKADETVRIAEEMGERERTIFFPEWLSYEDRESLLCEADVGAVLHPLHLETRFSARTRTLDFIWARLPILISDGDVVSEWVREHGLGRVAVPADPESVASALCELLDRPKADWAPAFERISEMLRWSNVVTPLVRYALTGGYAPDRQKREAPPQPVPEISWRARLARGVQLWRTAGVRVLLHNVGQYIQWRLARM